MESVIIKYLFEHVQPIKKQLKKFSFQNSCKSTNNFKIIQCIENFKNNAHNTRLNSEFDEDLLYWMTKIYGKEQLLLENQDDSCKKYINLVSNLKEKNKNQDLEQIYLAQFQNLSILNSNSDERESLDELNLNVSELETVEPLKKENSEKMNFTDNNCLLNSIIFITIFCVCFSIESLQNSKDYYFWLLKIFQAQATKNFQIILKFIYQIFEDLNCENFKMRMVPKIIFFKDDVIEISYTSRTYKKRKKFFEIFILEVCFNIPKLLLSSIRGKNFQKVRIESKHIKWLTE